MNYRLTSFEQIILTFQHWAGVSPYTSTYVLAETCVFGKQLPGPIHCGSHCCDHPFSRSYGVILPSSLTIVLSLTLGYSPRPPVSVFGTGTYSISPRSFSWKFGVIRVRFVRRLHFPITLQPYRYHRFAYVSAFVLRPESNNRLLLASFVTPSVK